MAKKKESIFVMGYSGGMGRSLVKTLINNGFFVYGASSKELQKLPINEKNFKKIYLDLNKVNTFDAVSQILNKEIQGEVVGVVNVSGISEGGDLLHFTGKEWNRSVNINLLGPTLISRYFITKSIQSLDTLSIVNIGSLSSFKGANKPQYAITKAGLIGLTTSVSRNYASKNIRINLVVPGLVDTPMISDWSQEKRENVINNIPAKKIADPDDVANLIMFLLSPNSSYITGQVIHINGGDY